VGSYVPSFALCILAIVLFALATFIHLGLSIRYRAWYMLPLTFACLMETVGYAERSLSAKKDPYRVTYYVLQYFFIVVAPVFLTASMYVTLNKLLAWAQFNGYDVRSRKWLKPKLILWGFVVCDVVSTAIQVTGAALIGKKESDREDSSSANNILLGGLAFQSAAFLTFIAILGFFVGSLVRDPIFGKQAGGKINFIFALEAASMLVLLRLLFRLAETAEGVFGYLMVHEAFFGALEFAPVILAVYILAFWHPGRWVPKQSVAGSSDGKA
jgi:hypothetical protein